MRRKVTLNLDEKWIAEIDRRRGHIPRSRFIEVIAYVSQPTSTIVVADAEPARGQVVVEEAPKAKRSPAPQKEIPLPKIARRHWA